MSQCSSGKTYSASEFRSSFPSSTVYSGDVHRHKFDCALAASYSRGPTYSDATVNRYAKTISSPDNIHYYGSEAANYGHDRSSLNKVLQSAYIGGRVYLTPDEASDI